MLISALVLSQGCAHYVVNDQNSNFDAQSGYRFDALDAGPLNGDSLFVCLMFSGGGTRAAALSYGVMEALRDTACRRPAETPAGRSGLHLLGIRWVLHRGLLRAVPATAV